MRIHDEQSQVEIVLSSKLFFGQVPFEIVFSASLLATNYDEESAGLLFLEKFEDVEMRFGQRFRHIWRLPTLMMKLSWQEVVEETRMFSFVQLCGVIQDEDKEDKVVLFEINSIKYFVIHEVCSLL